MVRGRNPRLQASCTPQTHTLLVYYLQEASSIASFSAQLFSTTIKFPSVSYTLVLSHFPREVMWVKIHLRKQQFLQIRRKYVFNNPKGVYAYNFTYYQNVYIYYFISLLLCLYKKLCKKQK